MLFADSRFGELAANTRAYSSAAWSDVASMVGKTTRAKNPVTMESRMIVIPSMMANNLENIEGRHCGFQTRSVINTSNEEVTGATHCSNERWMLGIVAEFLAQATDQNVDGTVIRFPINASDLIYDSVTAQDAAAVPDEQP